MRRRPELTQTRLRILL